MLYTGACVRREGDLMRFFYFYFWHSVDIHQRSSYETYLGRWLLRSAASCRRFTGPSLPLLLPTPHRVSWCTQPAFSPNSLSLIFLRRTSSAMPVDWSTAASFQQIFSSRCRVCSAVPPICSSHLVLGFCIRRFRRFFKLFNTFKGLMFACRLGPCDSIRPNFLRHG